MICEAITILGNSRTIDEHLILLLNAFSNLSNVTDPSGELIRPGDGSSQVYWQDLPALTIIFREYAMGTSSGCC